MLKWMILETKRILTSRRSLFVFVLLLVYSTTFFIQSNQQAQKRNWQRERLATQIFNESLIPFVNTGQDGSPSTINGIPDYNQDKEMIVTTYKTLATLSINMLEALENNDWRSYNYGALCYASYNTENLETALDYYPSLQSQYGYYLNQRDIVVTLRKQFALPVLNLGYLAYVYDEAWYLQMYPQYALNMQYYAMLYHEGSEPLNLYHITGGTVFFQYLKKLSGMMLIILIPLLYFDLFYKDEATGAIKTVLNASSDRRKLLLVKLGASFSSLLILLLGPALLLTGLFWITEGANFLYPVILDQEGLISLQSTSFDTFMLRNHLGLSQYDTSTLLAGRLVVVTMIQLLGYALILLCCSLLFYAALIVFITALCTNRYLCLGLLGMIVFFFSKLSLPDGYDCINPFLYHDVISTLEGITTTTWLNGLVTCLTAAALLFFLTNKLFKKRDLS